MTLKFRLWSSLEGVTAFVLLAVSAAFSVVLFVGFARTDWQVPLYVMLAIGFESTKCLLWIAGVVKDKLYFRLLAIAFAVLSLGASATTLLGEAQAEASKASLSSRSLAVIDSEIARLQLQASQYDQKWKDYSALQKDFSDRISALNSERLSISSAPAEATKSANNFSSLASVLVKDPVRSESLASLLRLVYIALVVLGIEVGGFALSSASLKQLKADSVAMAPKREYVGQHIFVKGNATLSQTACGRVFSSSMKVTTEVPAVVCPDCLKGGKNESGNTTPASGTLGGANIFKRRAI